MFLTSWLAGVRRGCVRMSSRRATFAPQSVRHARGNAGGPTGPRRRLRRCAGYRRGNGAGNYETLLANNGPRHTIVAGLKLGASVDGEADATPNVAATADDITTSDDEDGVVSPLTDLRLTTGAQPTITFRATNTTGTAATLYGWVDYNNNGVFDNATERASLNIPDGSNNSVFTLTLPTLTGSFTGKTFARFRLSTDVAAANTTAPPAMAKSRITPSKSRSPRPGRSRQAASR